LIFETPVNPYFPARDGTIVIMYLTIYYTFFFAHRKQGGFSTIFKEE